MVKNYEVKVGVIINKYDLNEEVGKLIIEYLGQEDIEIIAKLPFDRVVVDAMIARQSLYEYAPDAMISQKLARAYSKINSFQ